MNKCQRALNLYNIIFPTCVCCSDAVVSQILDELGLQLNDQLSGLPQATGSLSVTSKYIIDFKCI